MKTMLFFKILFCLIAYYVFFVVLIFGMGMILYSGSLAETITRARNFDEPMIEALEEVFDIEFPEGVEFIEAYNRSEWQESRLHVIFLYPQGEFEKYVKNNYSEYDEPKNEPDVLYLKYGRMQFLRTEEDVEKIWIYSLSSADPQPFFEEAYRQDAEAGGNINNMKKRAAVLNTIFKICYFGIPIAFMLTIVIIIVDHKKKTKALKQNK